MTRTTRSSAAQAEVAQAQPEAPAANNPTAASNQENVDPLFSPPPDRSANRIVIIFPRVRASIDGDEFKHEVSTKAEVRKLNNLGKLVEFHKVHGHTIVPVDHSDKQFQRWWTNVKETMCRRFEGLPETVKLSQFEEDILRKIGAWYNSDTGEGLYQHAAMLARAQQFKALIKAGGKYKKMHGHFNIFKEGSDENENFQCSIFKDTIFERSPIEGLRATFLKIKNCKVLSQDRIDHIFDTTGVNIRDVTLCELGWNEKNDDTDVGGDHSGYDESM